LGIIVISGCICNLQINAIALQLRCCASCG